MKTLKYLYPTLLLLVISLNSNARIIAYWTYEKLEKQSDLIIIASPDFSTETNAMPEAKNDLPEALRTEVVGVTTKLRVHAVLKGDHSLAFCLLHTYRLKDSATTIEDVPAFVDFSDKVHIDYLLFLKLGKDKTYVPVSGQIDPAQFSVLKIIRSDGKLP